MLGEALVLGNGLHSRHIPDPSGSRVAERNRWFCATALWHFAMRADTAVPYIHRLEHLTRLMSVTDDPLMQMLQHGEQVQAEAHGEGARLVVTDRRLAVVSRPDRPDLDIPFEGLRRIQFDIERERPATLVIVPEHRDDHPQVLAIAPEQYVAVGQALATIGRRLADPSTAESPDS